MDVRRALTRLWMITILVSGICGSRCYASVEPELTLAIRQGRLSEVRTLLSEGANVNARDEGEEQTPLMWAVQMNNETMVRVLLEAGAAVNSADNSGRTALMFAASKGNPEIVQMLLNWGADVRVRNAAGVTALTIANSNRHFGIVKLLAHVVAQHQQESPLQRSRTVVNR